MFSSACDRINVYILKLSQELEYESLTNKRVAVFLKKSHFICVSPNLPPCVPPNCQTLSSFLGDKSIIF